MWKDYLRVFIVSKLKIFLGQSCGVVDTTPLLAELKWCMPEYPKTLF